MILDSDELVVKKVKVLNAEILADLEAEDPLTIAASQCLLAICDDNLEVSIAETEVRVLLNAYDAMYQAQPFEDLRAVLKEDPPLESWWADIRTLVGFTDMKLRRSSWVQACQDFVAVVAARAAKGDESSPWAMAVDAQARAFLTLYHQYEIMKARTVKNRYMQ